MRSPPKKRTSASHAIDDPTNRVSTGKSSAIVGEQTLPNFWKAYVSSEAPVMSHSEMHSDIWPLESPSSSKPLVFRSGWPRKRKNGNANPNFTAATPSGEFVLNMTTVASPPASSSTGPAEMTFDFAVPVANDYTFRSGLPKAIQRTMAAEAASLAPLGPQISEDSSHSAVELQTEANKGKKAKEYSFKRATPYRLLTANTITHISQEPNVPEPKGRAGRSYWHDTSPYPHKDSATEAVQDPYHSSTPQQYYYVQHKIQFDTEQVIELDPHQDQVEQTFTSATDAAQPSNHPTINFIPFQPWDGSRSSSNGHPSRATRTTDDGESIATLPIPPATRGRRRSPIWNHFVLEENKFVCQLCKEVTTTFAASVTTRTLRKHVAALHPDYAEPQPAPVASNHGSSSEQEPLEEQ